MTPEFEAVVDALADKRYRYHDELALHVALAAALDDAGIAYEREVLCAGGKIDFAVGSIGIEVKVKGSAAALLEQVKRYAKDDRFAEFLVVTSRPAHRLIGPTADGKPLRVLTIGALSL